MCIYIYIYMYTCISLLVKLYWYNQTNINNRTVVGSTAIFCPWRCARAGWASSTPSTCRRRCTGSPGVGCDIHTHATAKQKGSTNLVLHPVVLRLCKLAWAWAWVWMAQLTGVATRSRPSPTLPSGPSGWGCAAPSPTSAHRPATWKHGWSMVLA